METTQEREEYLKKLQEESSDFHEEFCSISDQKNKDDYIKQLQQESADFHEEYAAAPNKEELQNNHKDDIVNMFGAVSEMIGCGSLSKIEKDLREDYQKHIRSYEKVKQQVLMFEFDKTLEECSDINIFIENKIKEGVIFSSESIINYCKSENIKVPEPVSSVSNFVRKNLIK